MTRPKTGGLAMEEASLLLASLAAQSGYRYQPIPAGWHTLTRPFAQRLFGHNQITDAFLLGLALHEDLTLVTFDKALLHLAGEHRTHVLLLNP
jgi:predicted nucleic acid-binding protein